MALHHIGSTAVPGLVAKPIIDMMLVVRNLAEVDATKVAFERISYAYAALKKVLARQYLYDIAAYCDGKDAFVKDVETKALDEPTFGTDSESVYPNPATSEYLFHPQCYHPSKHICRGIY